MVSSDPVVESGFMQKGGKFKKKVELSRIPVRSVDENEPDVNQSAPPPPSYEDYIHEIPIYPRLNVEGVPVVKQPTGLSGWNPPTIPEVNSILPKSPEVSTVVAVETVPSGVTDNHHDVVDITSVSKRDGGGAVSFTVDGCEKARSDSDRVESVEGGVLETSSGLICETGKKGNPGVRLMSPRDFEIEMRDESESELELEQEKVSEEIEMQDESEFELEPEQEKVSEKSAHDLPAEQVGFERNVIFEIGGGD